MGDRDDQANPARTSRRRFLQHAGVAGLAGLAAPLMAEAGRGAAGRSGRSPAPQPVLSPHCGATVLPSSSQTQVEAMQAWSDLAYPIGVVKCFFGDQQYPTTPDKTVAAAIQLGAEVILCYRPTFSGTSGPGGDKPSKAQLDADQAAMVASIQAMKNAGAIVTAVTMHSEPTGVAGLAADQYNYLYQWNYAALHSVARVGCCQSGGSHDQISNYFPGPTVDNPGATLYTDGLAVDYYGGNYMSKHYLSLWTSVADFAGVAFGIWESGDSAIGGARLTKDEASRFITSAGDPVNSMQAVLDYRKQHNLPNMHYLWFQNNNASGPNVISSPTDYRIPDLQALQASLP